MYRAINIMLLSKGTTGYNAKDMGQTGEKGIKALMQPGTKEERSFFHKIHGH